MHVTPSRSVTVSSPFYKRRIKEKPVDMAIKSVRGIPTFGMALNCGHTRTHSAAGHFNDLLNYIIVRFHFIVIKIAFFGYTYNKLSFVVVLCAVDATEDNVKALVSEMEMLSSIGPHKKIVSMLRVCTVGSEHCACVCVHVWLLKYVLHNYVPTSALSGWKPIALILFSDVLSVLLGNYCRGSVCWNAL